MSQSFPHLVEKKVCFAFQLVFVVFHCNSEFLEIYIWLNHLSLTEVLEAQPLTSLAF